MGRHLVDGSAIIIDEITEPMPGDQRSRNRCFRSRDHHVAVQRRWEESQHTCAYLGLWHTHPESTPQPSTIDHEDWRRAMASGTFFGEWLHFFIIGTSAISAWAGTIDGMILPMKDTTEENRNGES